MIRKTSDQWTVSDAQVIIEACVFIFIGYQSCFFFFFLAYRIRFHWILQNCFVSTCTFQWNLWFWWHINWKPKFTFDDRTVFLLRIHQFGWMPARPKTAESWRKNWEDLWYVNYWMVSWYLFTLKFVKHFTFLFF